MDKFAIYCTEEQVLNALMLGAPIREVGSESDAKKCLQHSKNFRFYEVPTAEEMIGWLETRGEFRIEISTGISDIWFYYVHISYGTNYKNLFYGGFDSRKEATLAAIDAALDYLLK